VAATTNPLRDADLLASEASFDSAQQSRRLELFAENGAKETRFAPHIIEPRAWCGRAELERNAAENAGRFGGIAHVDVRTFPSADPNKIWVTSRTGPEATSTATRTRHGFCTTFLLENGRLELWPRVLQRVAAARGVEAATQPH